MLVFTGTSSIEAAALKFTVLVSTVRNGGIASSLSAHENKIPVKNTTNKNGIDFSFIAYIDK
jgi:hypothetical protein